MPSRGQQFPPFSSTLFEGAIIFSSSYPGLRFACPGLLSTTHFVGRNLSMLKLLLKNPRSGFWIVAQGKRSTALGDGQINNRTLEEGAGNLCLTILIIHIT